MHRRHADARVDTGKHLWGNRRFGHSPATTVRLLKLGERLVPLLCVEIRQSYLHAVP